MDALFKALNDPTRRKILELLREKDMTAGDIADCFQISKPSISHHLDLLKQADLILSEKNGQFINYSINTSVLDECLSWMMDLAKRKRKGKLREPEKSKKRVAANSDSGRSILRRRPALG
ncbi:MAG: winged helix-turn-helix transcriptional regulator [Verrucomicrobia bacterium]|nr:winged helix-turn-helix transcriptional regulator [Verrucomicrobiota bacterium]